MTDANTAATDAGGDPVGVSEFDALVDRLRAWCAAGDGTFAVETVEGDADGAGEAPAADLRRAVCRFPASGATFAVREDGTVTGDMPLHGFEGRATELVFEDATVRVRGPETSYVYRRP